MKFAAILIFLFILAPPAHADQAEARDVARLNNCTPKKIEVYQNAPGAAGKTQYLVTCTLPKTTAKDAPPANDSLLIGCDQALCDVIRPLTAEKK